MTKPQLSPAAQVVLQAVHQAMAEQQFALSGVPDYRQAAAAALRAVADQIAPEAFEYNSGYCTNQAMDFELGQECRNEEIRKKLLAIAAKLKRQ